MDQYEKLLLKILSGTSDNNISFSKLINLLKRFDFEIRIKGSHHIITKKGVEEIINLQPEGNKAKSYQIKQVRNLLIKYKLADEQI